LNRTLNGTKIAAINISNFQSKQLIDGKLTVYKNDKDNYDQDCSCNHFTGQQMVQVIQMGC
jgi:hypothetical protein